MITDKDLNDRVRGLGLVIAKSEGEYRVALPLDYYRKQTPGAAERYYRERQNREAYFCDNRDDAYGTAILMAKEAGL